MSYTTTLIDTQKALHMWITRPGTPITLTHIMNSDISLARLAGGDLSIKELLTFYNEIFSTGGQIALGFPPLVLKAIRTSGYRLDYIKRIIDAREY